MPAPFPKLFQTPLNHYRIIRKLGKGGSGAEVFEVEDADGDRLALKYLCFVNEAEDSARVKRFLNEMKFGAETDHDHVLKVLDFDEVVGNGQSYPFYVMRLFPQSLADLIEAGIEQDKVLRYFQQMLDGVEVMHEAGFVHRDLKPENIFYLPGEDRLVIADFGIANFKEDDEFLSVLTETGVRLATVRYAAPEQIYGAYQPVAPFMSKMVDARADIYALGIMLNEMLTGRIPFAPHGYLSVEECVLHQAYLRVDGTPELYEDLEDLRDMLIRNEIKADWIDDVHDKYAPFDRLFAAMTERKPEHRLASIADVRGFMAEMGLY